MDPVKSRLQQASSMLSDGPGARRAADPSKVLAPVPSHLGTREVAKINCLQQVKVGEKALAER